MNPVIWIDTELTILVIILLNLFEIINIHAMVF
jgi:hypothetical protein